MKRLILFSLSFFLSFFLSMSSLSAQNIGTCGVAPPHTASGANLEEIYFDRFGNSYDVADVTMNNNFASTTMQMGYFQIEMVNLPSSFSTAILHVFSDLSQTVLQRNITNDCGDMIESEMVNIRITGTPDLGDGILGNGSDLYQYPSFIAENDPSCRILVQGKTYKKINGGTQTAGSFWGSPSVFDGLIHLNTSVDWHTSLDPIPSSSTLFDLYSVVLHEAIHVLGFSSTIGLSFEQEDFYTTWDKNLHLATNYSSTAGSSETTSLISSNCSDNCWNLNSAATSDYSVLSNLVGNSCNTLNDPIIVFGNTGIAPIIGGEGIVFPSPGNAMEAHEYGNFMSHLSGACGSEYLLMEPSLSAGVRRDILSNKELEILCELGYQTSSCNGCSIVTSSDFGQPLHQEEIGGCCENEFYACNTEVIVINPEDLLCNDQISNSSNAQITAVYSVEDHISVQMINGQIHVSNSTNSAGSSPIYYNLTGCDCQMETNVFSVLFDICPECDDDYCENLFCVSDFEGIETSSRPSFGYPHKYLNGSNNTPDILTMTGNNYIAIYGLEMLQGGESFVLELKEPILPNCRGILDFDAVGFGNAGTVEVLGSEFAPCNMYDAFINYGCEEVNCGDYIYSPQCVMDNINIDNFFSIGNPIVFQPQQVSFTNETAAPIHFLIFRAENSSSVFLDNLNLTKDCTNAEFDFTVDCPSVTFNPVNLDSDFTHFWEFGDAENSTSTLASPIFEYSIETGLSFTVSHTVTDECGNESISDMLIDLSECVVLPTCCPEGSVYLSGDLTLEEAVVFGLLPATESNSIAQTVCIDGTLRITHNYNFGIGSEVMLLENANIIVEEGIHFGARSTHFFGCEQRWNEILAEEGASISLTGCLIEDANNGVHLFKDNTLFANNCEFRKNYRGITRYGGSGMSVDNITLLNNNFNCTNVELLPPNLPNAPNITLAGIYVQSSAAFSVGGGNVFENIRTGIFSSASGINVKGCQFNNIGQDIGPLSLEGKGIYCWNGELNAGLNSFSNIPTGIFTRASSCSIQNNDFFDVDSGIGIQTANNEYINILYNEIHANKRGVDLYQNQGASYLRVSYNDIFMSENEPTKATGIYGNDTGMMVYENARMEDNHIFLHGVNHGIYLNGLGGVEVDANIINLLNASANFSGITVKSGIHNSLKCNDINGSGTGGAAMGLHIFNVEDTEYLCNEVSNTHTGTLFNGSCIGTQLKGTTFNNHTIGLDLSATALFSSPEEENIQKHNANKWLGSYSIAGARNEAVVDPILQINNIQFSVFHVNSMTGVYYPPSIDTPNAPSGSEEDWFDLKSGTNYAGCSTTQGGGSSDCPLEGLVGGGITELDKLIAKEELSFAIYDEERKWLAERSLYRKLTSNSALIGADADVSNFYSTKTGTTLGDLQTVEQDKKGLYALDSSTKAQLESERSQIDSYMEQLSSLDATLTTNSTTAQITQVKAQKATILNSIAPLSTSRRTLLEGIQISRSTSADWVKTQNGLIYTSKLYEANEKTVNEIYLRTIAKGEAVSNGNDISSLSLIAAQCPIAGGNAVFAARSILSGIYDDQTDYNDDAICAAAGIDLYLAPESDGKATIKEEKASINQNSGQNEFTIFPNPTSEKLEVRNDLENGDYDLIIYNTLGEKIFNTEINSDHTSISTQNWEEGVYFLKIYEDRKNIWSEKVIIIH